MTKAKFTRGNVVPVKLIDVNLEEGVATITSDLTQYLSKYIQK